MAAAMQTAAKPANQRATAVPRWQTGKGVDNNPPIKVDYLEAGSSGPVVMLVHSSVSGARQWRRLMDDLKGQFRVRAVNLFGYGKTPPWPAETTQTLDDQARLVEAVLPADADEVYLVGHSFGGSVAMKAAARLVGRVAKLVLLETNPFYLLAQSGRVGAFAEAMELRNYIKKFGTLGEWTTAAEKFADYWGGAGTWQGMSLDRRMAFSEALKPNFFEWDAVMNETTPVEQWATLLPRTTLLVCDPGTVLPIREIAVLLRRSCPGWAYKEVLGAGHMAPLTRPDLINPLVVSFLGSPANNEGVTEVRRGRVPNQA
jgi:pimeloyl-ACP methyl ester carboxylesterase